MGNQKVREADIRKAMPELHSALIEIVSAANRPERDDAMLEAANLKLERALFPLLVLIGKLGPIGVVDVAGRVGRDYTTVSRQVGRLEELGLIKRRISSTDGRLREAVITPRGKTATDALDQAREQLFISLFRDWGSDDFKILQRLMRTLADGLAELRRQDESA